MAEANLDGTRTEYFEVDCAEATLLALLRECFEEHWREVIFGPCIEGAVYEGRFAERPTVTLSDGYATIDVPGAASWHFHLCIGTHRGSAALPTPPALAEWRRCARAAFFRSLDARGVANAWGLRLWNGRRNSCTNGTCDLAYAGAFRIWSMTDLWAFTKLGFLEGPAGAGG